MRSKKLFAWQLAEAMKKKKISKAPTVSGGNGRPPRHDRVGVRHSMARESRVSAYSEAEEWQLSEIRAGIHDLDENHTVAHDRVMKWLRSWGTAAESRAPK